jgi:hypothetical protein
MLGVVGPLLGVAIAWWGFQSAWVWQTSGDVRSLRPCGSPLLDAIPKGDESCASKMTGLRIACLSALCLYVGLTAWIGVRAIRSGGLRRSSQER